MKRVLVLMLAMLLACSAFTTALAAPRGFYDSTNLFLDQLDELDVDYSYHGIDSDDDEKVTVTNTSSAINLTYTITYFFSSDNESVSIKIWDLLTFAEEDMMNVLIACNAANRDWRYVNFLVEDDLTVTAETDEFFRGETAGEVTLDATLSILSVLDNVYEEYFGAYAK